jgi:hypothetical protein
LQLHRYPTNKIININGKRNPILINRPLEVKCPKHPGYPHQEGSLSDVHTLAKAATSSKDPVLTLIFILVRCRFVLALEIVGDSYRIEIEGIGVSLRIYVHNPREPILSVYI